MYNKIELSEYELAAPKLFHAICGAVFAEKELGCTDEEIITAVRYHTTGRSNMTLLEKVIFIADFIGKERNYDGVEIMREKAFRFNFCNESELPGFSPEETLY